MRFMAAMEKTENWAASLTWLRTVKMLGILSSVFLVNVACDFPPPGFNNIELDSDCCVSDAILVNCWLSGHQLANKPIYCSCFVFVVLCGQSSGESVGWIVSLTNKIRSLRPPKPELTNKSALITEDDIIFFFISCLYADPCKGAMTLHFSLSLFALFCLAERLSFSENTHPLIIKRKSLLWTCLFSAVQQQ